MSAGCQKNFYFGFLFCCISADAQENALTAWPFKQARNACYKSSIFFAG
jgi:hypothetical protein